MDNWSGLFVCIAISIPIVAIICNCITTVYRIMYGPDNNKEDENNV